jgi:hypothetical protein
MERRYSTRIRSDFGAALDLPQIESLDIPDEYGVMDPELIALIRSATEHYIAMAKPNQSTDPTLASGTPPAGQELRHP